jgi:hypothetical protein
MLRLLLDSHIPPDIATASRRLAALSITPLRDWHRGLYLNESDAHLLARAWNERVTMVTYDVNTFPLAVKERLESGLDHAGVVYVSSRFRQNAIGTIARRIVKLWESERHLDWTNRIRFLN